MQECARCGFDINPLLRVKSKHTGQYYCGDLDACRRRRSNDLTNEEGMILLRKIEKKAKKILRKTVVAYA